MTWPDQAIEQIPTTRFQPPFCPNPRCKAHHNVQPGGFRFHRHGVYIRKGDGRVVPRFLCLGCGATFSQQTFSTTYYLKVTRLLVPVAAGLLAGSAHRQLARSLHCAPSTVTRLSARLGRHAMLFQSWALKRLDAIREPVVYDDFESFACSQDLPLGMGTAVGQDSWFWYSLQHARHRRGGRRKLARKTQHLAPEPTPGAYRRAFRRTLQLLVGKLPENATLELISDGHPEYRSGLRDHPARRRVRHRIFPNPKQRFQGARRTPEARRRDREMFAVDLLHSLIRHSQAHHRRETIAFGRRHNALIERGFLMMAWRNFIKRRTERGSDPTTPAMILGLTDRPWSWARLLSQRLFVKRIGLSESWMRVYRREIVTPQIGANTRHRLIHAF